jgi:putative transcriptional regulator
MDKNEFSLLIESIKQAGKIKRGELSPGRRVEFDPLDIKAIRKRLNKSQRAFALMIGISVSTLQNWEQNRRKPEGPAKALLKIASVYPDEVSKALEA